MYVENKGWSLFVIRDQLSKGSHSFLLSEFVFWGGLTLPCLCYHLIIALLTDLTRVQLVLVVVLLTWQLLQCKVLLLCHTAASSLSNYLSPEVTPLSHRMENVYWRV